MANTENSEDSNEGTAGCSGLIFYLSLIPNSLLCVLDLLSVFSVFAFPLLRQVGVARAAVQYGYEVAGSEHDLTSARA
jgi:hypothetical protein